MKKLVFLLVVSPLLAWSQEIPADKWLNDSNFEDKIHEKDAFGDDEMTIHVIEFYAEFNKDNAFNEWDKLEHAQYYRVNIAESPNAKKDYRVRMAPTIIIFKDGIKEVIFKAGLDLLLPTNLQEIQESIEEIRRASAF